VVQKKQLSCVFQRWAKERCRFVQEMHESPNCARNTGQEEKGQKGGRRRWSSAGERVVYNMNRGAGEGRVKKLDVFSVCRVQTSRAIWRGSTTRLAQHDRGRVQRSIARVQSSTK
jgi:ribosomal protein L14